MIDTVARWLDPPLHILFWLPAKLLHKEVCSACTLAVRIRQALLLLTYPVRRWSWIDHHRIDWEMAILWHVRQKRHADEKAFVDQRLSYFGVVGEQFNDALSGTGLQIVYLHDLPREDDDGRPAGRPYPALE